jgi:hypothetical protein
MRRITYRLNRDLMAGNVRYPAGVTYVDTEMPEIIEEEFVNNPSYFDHVSTVDIDELQTKAIDEDEDMGDEVEPEPKPKPKKKPAKKKKVTKKSEK